jgi:hypothetical protein
MNFKFESLTLNCRENVEEINFSPQISYFHGEIGTGKSSIARLIDFCLGGDLVRTPAISQELISVQLISEIGNNRVVFKRDAEDSNHVEVSWIDSQGKSFRTLCPVNVTYNAGPIWDNNIYTLSDLLFYFVGISPMKIPLSRYKPDTKSVRLSFRDIMWYCYIEQGHFDSSFFKLDSPILMQKSRYAMRFVLRNLTEKLAELENGRLTVKKLIMDKTNIAKELWSFLKQFGYNSDQDLHDEIDEIKQKMREDSEKLATLQKGYAEGTHFVDNLRDDLRKLNSQIAQEQQVLFDLNARVAEQESLKAELLTAKIKLSRLNSAIPVFSGVQFEKCPACGMMIKNEKEPSDNTCYLCGQVTSQEKHPMDVNLAKRDLDSRLDELEESLERLTEAQIAQKRQVKHLEQDKMDLDRKLDEKLKEYDSRFLANSRETERKIAASEERIKGLYRILEMPKAVGEIEKEIDKLNAEEERLKRQIREEKEYADQSTRYVLELEESFLRALLASGMPAVKSQDKVKINTTTWIPEVLISGNQTSKWNFESAGSGGKKTLFNACFILALHEVAAKRNLPLPSFIIIDTPMKNISEDVNRSIFESFYTYLYRLAEGPLSNTQFIIIDKEYFAPKIETLNIRERLMLNNDPAYPPLFRGYFGP